MRLTQLFENQTRVAGLLLLASFAPFAIFAMLEIRGDSPGVYGLFRPIEELAERLPLRAWGLVWQVLSLILVMAGFGVLAVSLQDAGDRALPLIAFALLLAFATLMAFEGTFYQALNPWAAKEAVRTGSTPELYEAMRTWFNTFVQIVYMMFGLLAYAGFGWSLLRTDLLPSGAGWSTILWSLGWLLFTVIAQTTIPAGVFLWPWVRGIILVVSGS